MLPIPLAVKPRLAPDPTPFSLSQFWDPLYRARAILVVHDERDFNHIIL
jgi:hypothetical protein